MAWQEERERLLSDTIAFVQRATGEGLVLAVKAKAPRSPAIEAAALHLRQHHATRRQTQVADLRRELGSLFEAFDNMQQALSCAIVATTAPAPDA